MTNEIRDALSSYDTTSLHKEIDLIQNCISRMAQNSFLIKGWSITLIVITWAILGKESGSCLSLLLLIIPILAFWGLDGYFLRLERMYRKMYEWLLKARIEEKNFTKPYDLNPSRFQTDVASWLRVVFSRTLLSFYLTLVVIVIIGAGIMFCIS
ncbi:hypothetical protein [Methanorbis rubei]|uniref:Uncharacterized protein n=1 Tax=Methanorbis rubei TaxID=3028300 RepID=A0AAE4SC23_9EURY|nr:hypothetical protein [Methanocorpusculaceae archaeon Cs1]